MNLSLNKEIPVIRCKTLLITGDGRSLHVDVANMDKMWKGHDIGCIGRSIRLFPKAVHWFNADGETAIAWVKKIDALSHTLGDVEGFDYGWDIDQPDYQFEAITGQRGRLHGSSALFAVLAALKMGYKKIVLAGCPLDAEGHWYFDPDTPETKGPVWLGHDFMAWIDFADSEDSKKVRSFSGYTKQLLGKPDLGWVYEGN